MISFDNDTNSILKSYVFPFLQSDVYGTEDAGEEKVSFTVIFIIFLHVVNSLFLVC